MPTLPRNSLGRLKLVRNSCPPELSKNVSNDGGVDLIAEAKVGKHCLYIQSKPFIDRADDIDSIISKFQAYTSTNAKQLKLFDPESTLHHFLIITLPSLTGILQQYGKSHTHLKNFINSVKLIIGCTSLMETRYYLY